MQLTLKDSISSRTTQLPKKNSRLNFRRPRTSSRLPRNSRKFSTATSAVSVDLRRTSNFEQMQYRHRLVPTAESPKPTSSRSRTRSRNRSTPEFWRGLKKRRKPTTGCTQSWSCPRRGQARSASVSTSAVSTSTRSDHQTRKEPLGRRSAISRPASAGMPCSMLTKATIRFHWTRSLGSSQRSTPRTASSATCRCRWATPARKTSSRRGLGPPLTSSLKQEQLKTA